MKINPTFGNVGALIAALLPLIPQVQDLIAKFFTGFAGCREAFTPFFVAAAVVFVAVQSSPLIKKN